MKGWSLLLVEELVHHFTKARNYAPAHINELLDYLQKCYIDGELSIVEYKQLFSDLTKLNAEKPSDFFINAKQMNLDFELPC